MSKSIVVKNLVKHYGRVRAVDGISFEVNPGEIFALIGPNGAGKSTTLRILATVIGATSGNISIYNLDIVNDADKIRKIISYLPEEAGAYRSMSGEAYLKFMAALFTDNKQKQKKFVKYAVEITDLNNRIKDKVSTYSKGMVRKLLLARAVMMEPKLAILDEPTSGLDVINAIYIRKTIRNLAKSGMSVLLSSHNMLEIEFLSDRVGIINEGKIIEIGTSDELKKKYSAKNLEEVFVEIKGIKLNNTN